MEEAHYVNYFEPTLQFLGEIVLKYSLGYIDLSGLTVLKKEKNSVKQLQNKEWS